MRYLPSFPRKRCDTTTFLVPPPPPLRLYKCLGGGISNLVNYLYFCVPTIKITQHIIFHYLFKLNPRLLLMMIIIHKPSFSDPNARYWRLRNNNIFPFDLTTIVGIQGASITTQEDDIVKNIVWRRWMAIHL